MDLVGKKNRKLVFFVFGFRPKNQKQKNCIVFFAVFSFSFSPLLLMCWKTIRFHCNPKEFVEQAMEFHGISKEFDLLLIPLDRESLCFLTLHLSKLLSTSLMSVFFVFFFSGDRDPDLRSPVSGPTDRFSIVFSSRKVQSKNQ